MIRAKKAEALDDKQAGTNTSGQILFWPGILTRRLILTGVNPTSATAEAAERILSKAAGKRKKIQRNLAPVVFLAISEFTEKNEFLAKQHHNHQSSWP